MSRYLLPSLVVLLAACAAGPKKQYVEPNDPEIEDCINACNVVKMECRTRARDEYEYCNYVYERKLAEHNYCVNAGGKFCIKPERCPGPRVRGCSANYDQCFVECGGRIETEAETEPADAVGDGG